MILQDGNVFAAAVQWLSETLLGSLATSLAVIAVASFGFLLLNGRIDVRRGVQVIFGCFTLFGASTIASGLLNAVHGTTTMAEETAVLPPPPSYPVAPPQAQRSDSAYDPYAGAALPARR